MRDFRRDLPGYVEKVTQEKLSENSQYDNTDSISSVTPIDINDLGSQKQLHETADAKPLTGTRDIGAQPPEKENNRAVGLITKTDVGSQKFDNRDIGSQGNADRDISVPGNTTTDVGSGKNRDDLPSVGDLFRSRKRQHADNSNALNSLLYEQINIRSGG